MKRLLAALLALFVLPCAPVFGADSAPGPHRPVQDRPEKNVLVVLPYTQDFPAHTSLVRGLKKELQAQARYTVRFSHEFLDLARFANEESYLAEVAGFFEKKYSRLKPDIIVTGATLSGFMLEYGARVFPGVPIVFAWNENIKSIPAMPEGFFIVSGNVDHAANIGLVFQTRPSTRKVFVVVGDSNEERALVSHISEAARAYADRAEFVFLNRLSHAKMLEAVRGAGEDAAILFVRWLRDAEGEAFIPAEVLKTIHREATAPVYGVVEHLLGEGMIGGFLYSLELLGRRIADTVQDVFSGEVGTNRVSRPSSSEYAFDWRQLKRWNIDERLLPPGSRIEFREESAWDMYRGYVLAGIAVFILETMLIGGLVANRVRRRKVEAELKRLNESLEEMVASRTGQLQEANGELEQAKRALEAMNTRLETVSRTDSLTGLFNRRHLEEFAQREHARYVRTGKRFSVVMCDIDFFKSVNDQHGHDAGDSLLRMVGQDISRAVRPYDILARWGGEEFLLFLPSTEPDLARAIAERIRQDIGERVYAYEGHSLRLTATLGVATVRDGESVSEVIRRADVALYQGKRSGRNRVVAG